MKYQPINSQDFKTLFEAVADLYLVLTPDLKIVAASDAYLKATLVKREQILGRDLFNVFPDNPHDSTAKSSAHLQASLDRVLSHKKPDVMAIQKYDIRRPSAEGGGFEERHWSPLNSPVIGPDGEVKYIIHRVEDVTDFVKLKQERVKQIQVTKEIRSEKNELEKLRHSQRMEAMGALAGGVAHDFNNILTIIILICENLLSNEQFSESARTKLKLIAQSGEKAAALTHQLLTFSRNKVLKPKVLNLNNTLVKIKELLSRLLKENIEFKTLPGQNLKNILADEGQMEQILLNLVINAKDAIPSDGKITVETSNVELDTTMAMGNMKVEPGSYVMLAVRDSGVGMDAKTQARIFEPFFTTKKIGKGTGLGLSTVYGIVRQNKGTIWVYSEVNKGTTFKVFFPQTYEKHKVEAPKQKEKATRHSGEKTISILVVEDQELIREFICSILKELNYKVYQAENGNVALEILKEINYSVNLIITDIIMPGLGGQEMITRLNSLGHKIKTLYLSGFSEDVIVTSGKTSSFQNFLEKPFNISELTDKVNSMLSCE